MKIKIKNIIYLITYLNYCFFKIILFITIYNSIYNSIYNNSLIKFRVCTDVVSIVSI